ncbi:glutathione S-transferase [bacterium]|nr:glutathione S-transferase [bacterium]
MKLYRHPLSGHSHRVETFLSLLQRDYELVDVDLMAGEHQGERFLKLNPFGQVPVLVDQEVTLSDSTAILVYLARKYGPEWLPSDALAQAQVQKWLSVASGEVAAGPGAARLVKLFGAQLDYTAALSKAHKLLGLLEAHLSSRDFLASDRPTVADVAVYSYVALAPDGGVSLENYPKVRSWIARLEALPHFLAVRLSPTAQA